MLGKTKVDQRWIDKTVAVFDTWQPGYGQASVLILRAGTSDPADVFTDEALTNPADNPQTLLEKIDNSISYGRWSVPLYTGQPYELQINSVDRTGIKRVPLTTSIGRTPRRRRSSHRGCGS
jgi:hypothetical protein